MKSRTSMILLFAILLTVGAYFYYVIPGCLSLPDSCVDLYAATLNGTSDAPFRYRVLSPAIIDVLAGGDRSALGYTRGDMIFEVMLFPLFYIGLYRWLRRSLSEDRALIGVLLPAVLMHLAFWRYIFTPWTTLELVLLVWALVWYRHDWIYAALVALATLNRETGILLIAVYVALHREDWKTRIPQVVGFVLIWAGLTAGLHIWRGSAEHVLGLAGTLNGNLVNLPEGIFNNLLLVPLWVMAAGQYQHTSRVNKALAWVSLGYAALVFIGALWQESPRLLLPVLVLVMPMMLEESPKR